MEHKNWQENELKQIGHNIRRLRKAQNASQMTLAYQAGTRPTTISELENGLNSNPGWDLLNRVCRALNTTIHDLTVPDTRTLTEEQTGMITQGLADLLENQDKYLADEERRINLSEVEWLKKLPVEDPGFVSPEGYLVILRHLRLLAENQFYCR